MPLSEKTTNYSDVTQIGRNLACFANKKYLVPTRTEEMTPLKWILTELRISTSTLTGKYMIIRSFSHNKACGTHSLFAARHT